MAKVRSRRKGFGLVCVEFFPPVQVFALVGFLGGDLCMIACLREDVEDVDGYDERENGG